MKKFPGTKFISLYILCLTSYFIAGAQAGEWTWMSGSNTINGTESYGTQGIPSVNNHPSGLYEPCEWTDTSGMFWLYSGISPVSDLANLWMYNPNTNEWTWVSGPGNIAQSPVYGTQGVADPLNTPGTRIFGATTWTGKDNTLWLFGGYNTNDYSSFGSKNDLWKYDISTNEWTWIKGPDTNDDLGSYGIQGVASSANVPAARSECAASWVDNDSNLWLFGGWIGSNSYNDLWKYNIITNEWTWMKGSSTFGAAGVYGTKGVANASNTPGARNGYTKWNDGNDNLYLFAGDNFIASDLYNDVWKYSVATNEWTWISGTNNVNNAGVYTSHCTPDVNIYPSCRRESRACWVDPCKKFWVFGGSSQSSLYGSRNDLWKFDPVSLEWTWVSGASTANQSGSFGTQGVSSPANQPPSRAGNIGWMDKSGNLWMFGGTYQSGVGSWNDLWRYIPDTSCGGGTCIAIPNTQINFIASLTQICEKFCVDFYDSSQNNPTAWLWEFPGGNPSSSTNQNPMNICYNSPGTYDVTLIATNANGNDTLTLYNYITVYPTPPFPTITQAGYTLTSSPANSYQWQLNTIDIAGATNQSYNILQSGLYTVIVGDSNNCKNSFSIYVLISGINDEMGDKNISISPNPSSGNFTVEFIGVTDDVSIEVVNTIGQIIFSSSESRSVGVSSSKKEIDLGSVVAGVYIIEIKTKDVSLRKKIVIEE